MRARLGELGTVITGNTPSKQELKYWASSDIPFIKPDVMNQDGITELQTANEYVSEIARSKARIVGKSVVLVTCIGTIGKVCLTGRECAFNQQINAIIPNDRVLPEYLAYCIYYNRPKLTELANAPVVPIINKRQFEDFSINIEENVERQGSIVTILKEVDRLICYRRQQLQKLDKLVKARFVELFGDPISNSHALPEATLPELGEFGRGVSKHRPRNDPKLLGGKYPLIQTGDVASANLYITSYTTTYSELGLAQSKMWGKGTLCITIAANIAKTAILNFDACFPDSIVGFTANGRTNNIFIHYWFSFFQEILESQAPESAQKNINLKILSELKVIVPSKEKQDAFAAFVTQTDKSKAIIQKALNEVQLLFDSLMQNYFG